MPLCKRGNTVLQCQSSHGTHVSAHRLQGGERQHLHAAGDGNASRRAVSSPGQLLGTPHLIQCPLSLHPHDQFSIRLRGNTFFTSFRISCPSGLWCWQPWVSCVLGTDEHPSPTPAALRGGGGRAGAGPPALPGVLCVCYRCRLAHP